MSRSPLPLWPNQSAARQGNRLHMNVYETRGQPARVPITKMSGTEPKRGFRPPQHCPALAQVVSRKVQAAVPEQGMVRLALSPCAVLAAGDLCQRCLRTIKVNC